MFVDLSAMQKKKTRELSNSVLSEELETYIQRITKHTDVIKMERKLTTRMQLVPVKQTLKKTTIPWTQGSN